MPENYEQLKQSVYAVMGVAAESLIDLMDQVYSTGYNEGRDKGYSYGYDVGYENGTLHGRESK